jgi:hypothetical protein
MGDRRKWQKNSTPKLQVVDSSDGDKSLRNAMGIGVVVGVAVGAAMDNVGLGSSLGVALGRRRKPIQENRVW